MKLTGILLAAACLHLSAAGLSQKITISGSNLPLTQVFKAIEKQTDYVFFFDNNLLLNTRPVSLQLKDASLEDVLNATLKGQSLEYKIRDKLILVVKKTEPALEIKYTNPPTGQEVRGVVLNEKGSPLAGATIRIIGINKTVSANEKGEFVFPNVPNGKYNVEISFVGYDKYNTTIQVLSNTVNINAAMRQALSSLDEAVVIAYGTTTKRLNTGNVSTVTGETISKQPVGDPLMALEGRVPGVYISQNSGIPGAVSSVQLRGQNFIPAADRSSPSNLNSPLFIVDGVPVTSATLTYFGGALGNAPNGAGLGMSPFNSINPADIESIDVLKDADATAIYGSRGANGVVLITTKKGKSGKTRFDLNVYTGSGKIASKINMMNTQQYLTMRKEALKNDGKTPGTSDYDVNGTWDTTRYTDWEKLMIGGTSNFTNAQASLSGGNAGTQFLIGTSYNKQTTVYPGDYAAQKGSFHFNLNHTSSDHKFNALFTAGYVRDYSKLPTIDFASNITLAPNSPVIYDNNGNLNWANSTFSNPYGALSNDATAVTDNLISNLNLSYQLLPGLQVKSSFGYTHIQLNQTNITRLAAFNPAFGSANNRSLVLQTNDVNTWIIEPQLNYTKRVGNGKLDVLLGSTIQQNTNTANAFTGSGFSSDNLIKNIAAASTISINRYVYTQYRYDALFGRINYDWKDKYIINATARRDGSSRFGPGKQFGNFGAIGAAWIFTQEQFIKRNLSFLSFGKLRASYGSTGNDQLPDYQYLSAYSSSSSTNTYQNVSGLSPTRLVNPDFAWEVVKKLEFGLDLGFFKDRIFLNASYYFNQTGNQLVGYPLPATTGFTTVQFNLPAVVQNNGVELELNAINIKTTNFSWNTSFNLSVPRNRLASYPGLEGSAFKQTYAIDKPLSVVYTAHNTGVDLNTGLYAYEDVNKDGIISSLDYQFLKSITQDFYGGFLNSFAYKGFQLDVFLQFVKQTGYDYRNLFNASYPVGMFNQNQPTYFLGRWQKPGDLTGIEKFSASIFPSGARDGSIQDASFIRLKNLSLSYTLPISWTQKVHLQNARIYLQGQNLFTITKYEGFDPETRNTSLPPLKMLTAGIQLTF